MTSSTEGIFPTALAFGSVRAGGVAAFGRSFLSQTAALREFPEQYREIIVGYNSILERYCRGNYLNAERKRKARETGACGKVDGSMEQCVTTGAE